MGDSVIDNRQPRSLTDGEDSTEEQMQFHPPELWGLDYQFNVYNKMYIRDILLMNQYSMFPGMVTVPNFCTLFLFMFSYKMLVMRAGIHKLLVRIANREDPDQTAS